MSKKARDLVTRLAAAAWLTAAPSLSAAQAPRAAGGDRPAADRAHVLRDRLMVALDNFERGGRWKDSDSAILGWSCGQQLQALVCLHQATGRRLWLDRLFRYAETMFANLTPNRQGFLSWRSRRYSPAYAAVQPAEANRSKAQITPRQQWITDSRLRGGVKDAGFRLVAQEDAALAVEAVTPEGKAKLPVIRYRLGKAFSGPFGIRLTVEAAPAPGDVFTLVTRQPKDFDYAVHDGMVLMPICRAIELVRQDRALSAAYGRRADKLLATIETQLIPKWSKSWRRVRDGAVLVFPDDPAFVPSNTSLPHNQYLALGTVLVALHRITQKGVYKERADQMARAFRSCLRLVEDHYEWNYWDAMGPWDKPYDKPSEKRPEDTGHGSLDIGFVLACADGGIVFIDADLKRFAGTFVKVMWNGSADSPTVGGWVNTTKPSRQSGNLHEWLLLCRVEPRIQRICERILPTAGSLWAQAQLYLLWANQAADAGE